jgi:hypothetical protein
MVYGRQNSRIEFLELYEASSNPYYYEIYELYLVRDLREASYVLYIIFKSSYRL